MSDKLDLRQYVPGLPSALTREYLEGLTADKHAALVRTMETGINTLREEQIRAEEAITQRTAEVERLEQEAQAEFGVKTPEELGKLLEEETERCVALWADVAELMAS